MSSLGIQRGIGRSSSTAWSRGVGARGASGLSGRGSRASVVGLPVGVAVVAVVLLVFASAAQAASKGVSGFFPSTLGTGGTGGGTGQFDSPRGVAVNVSGAGAGDPGDLYVVDGGNNRVQVFSGAGAFKFAFGRDVLKPGSPGNVPNNEQQTIAVAGATGGSFQLRLFGADGTIGDSAPIPFGALPEVVDAAIEAMPTVGAGNVSVTSSNPYTVEFVGALADTDVNLMTAQPGGLTPGGATVTVATTVPGANAAERCAVAADCKRGISGAAGGMFNNPQGIAIDQADGSVYVSEQGNRRVQKFTAEGDFVRAWGRNVSVSDVSNGAESCVTASDCQAGTAADATLARGGEFGAGGGQLAVAPPAAPNAGNVVVADPGSRRVQEFGPAGGFVRAWGFDVVAGNPETGFEVCAVATGCKSGVAGAGVGQFASNQPTRVAVDSTGVTYTSEPSGNFRVQRFDAALAAPVVFAPGLLSGTAATDGPGEVAIGSGDNVLVGKQFAAGTGSPAALVGERRVLELDSTGAPVDVHAAGAGIGNGSGGSVDGLTLNPSTGVIYLAASRFWPLGASQSSGAARVYMLESTVPSVGSLGVSAVTAHSALLSGSVNPNGPANPLGTIGTSYRLEVSKDGSTWTPVVRDADVGNGTSNVGFSLTATDLEAGTAYQTRLVLTRSFHFPVLIPGPPFATPASRPDVDALAPTDREATSVTLGARINPNGSPTTYRFEYGPTAAYGTAVAEASAGSGSAAAVFFEPIAGLQPGTTYHFRVVATNATGTAVSADRTFTTRDGGDPPGRGYEMVSQPDKIGGVGVGLWPGGVGHLASSGMAAYTGERFMVGGSYGAPLNGDTKHGFTNDWSFAERGDDQTGWSSHSPITHPNYQPSVGQFVQVLGVSEDLDRAYMNGGNVTPAIFPEMGADNRWSSINAGFFLDWGTPPAQSSRWELLGPATLDQLSPAASSGDVWNLAFSADGSALVAQPTLDLAGTPRGNVFGLGGPGDPTWPAFGDLVAGRSVYLADTSGAPADTFAGTGERELVNVCTGVDGERTRLPWVNGEGVLEEAGCPAASAGRDARLISERGAALAPSVNDPLLAGTISADGSRVFFMSPDPRATGVPDGTTQQCVGTGPSTTCPPQLYVRQRDADGNVRTRWISRAVPELFGTQQASLTGSVRFEGATPSGDRVFFRTNAPLTTDDPNGQVAAPPGGVRTGTPASDSWDLYMYDFPDDPNADPATGELTRISAGPTASGDCNSPLPADPLNQSAAALRFASDDGRRVYFVCTAPLAQAAAKAGGTITSPAGTSFTADQTNLYLYDEHESGSERWSFIGRLPRAAGTGFSLDACASSGASPRSPLYAASGGTGPEIQVQNSSGSGANCFSGASDGGFVTFFTPGRLMADDPPTPVTGDVYAYDAVADELIRVTAPRGGVGGTYLCAPGRLNAPAPTDTAQCNGDGGVDYQSAVLTSQGGVVNPGLGVMTDSAGSGEHVAFFQSKSRLVAGDLDGGYDVYQWRDGELSLVTSGAVDSKDSLYKGNDRDGRNVFFVTRDRLSWQDYDDVADIYTARVGGGIEEPDPPAICDVLAGVCQDDPGAGSVDAVPVTAPDRPDDNAVSERQTLSLAAVGSKARRRAARTGVIALRVRASGAGTVRVVGRARLGGKAVKVADKRQQVAGTGVVEVRVPLSARARRALRAGRRLSVSLRVSKSGARSRTATVQLERRKP